MLFSWTMMAMRVTFCLAQTGDGGLQQRQRVECMSATNKRGASSIVQGPGSRVEAMQIRKSVAVTHVMRAHLLTATDEVIALPL